MLMQSVFILRRMKAFFVSYVTTTTKKEGVAVNDATKKAVRDCLALGMSPESIRLNCFVQHRVSLDVGEIKKLQEELEQEGPTMPDYLKQHLEGIDATMFSGCDFQEPENRAALRIYIAGWEREMAKIEEA